MINQPLNEQFSLLCRTCSVDDDTLSPNQQCSLHKKIVKRRSRGDKKELLLLPQDAGVKMTLGHTQHKCLYISDISVPFVCVCVCNDWSCDFLCHTHSELRWKTIYLGLGWVIAWLDDSENPTHAAHPAHKSSTHSHTLVWKEIEIVQAKETGRKHKKWQQNKQTNEFLLHSLWERKLRLHQNEPRARGRCQIGRATDRAAKNNSKISNHEENSGGGGSGSSSGWQRLTFGSLKATTASALHLKHGKWPKCDREAVNAVKGTANRTQIELVRGQSDDGHRRWQKRICESRKPARLTISWHFNLFNIYKPAKWEFSYKKKMPA